MVLFEGKGIPIPPYTTSYYEYILESSRQAAKLILELIDPKSVIDIGCGPGAWLSILNDYSIKDVLGADYPLDKRLFCKFLKASIWCL